MSSSPSITESKGAMTDDSTSQATSLFRLPNEVFDDIIALLDPGTFKHLRLAINGKFDQLLLRRLFHFIVLSKLKRDRDVFLNIASEPKLACHVRRIVWCDLPADHSYAERNAWLRALDELVSGEGSPSSLASDDHLYQRRHQELDALADKCWLVPYPLAMEENEGQIGERYLTEIKRFLPTFMSAVHNMPSVCAVQFRYMDPYRLCSLRDENGEPFHFPLLEACLEELFYPENLNYCATPNPPTSEVCNFDRTLSQEVEASYTSLCANGEIVSRVEHRFYPKSSSDGHRYAVYYAGLDPFFRQIDHHPLQKVTEVSMTFDFTNELNMTLAVSALAAIELLTNVKLKYTGSDPSNLQWSSMQARAEKILLAGLKEKKTTWPNLNVLVLERAVLSPEGLQTLIQDHAPYLEMFNYINGGFTTSHVASLSTIKTFRLFHIAIVGNRGGEMLVPEKDLEAYLNKGTSSNGVNVLDQIMQNPETATGVPIITSTESGGYGEWANDIVSIDCYIAKPSKED